jgi:hypothetical protein
MYIHCIVMLEYDKLKWFLYVVPLVLLLVVGMGQAGIVKAWDGDGDGEGSYWHHGLGWLTGGSYWGQVGSVLQNSCGACGDRDNYWSQGYQTCGSCADGGGGGQYHSYRYLVGFQDGVQDAQAGNNYDCQIGYHTVNYCNGYSANWNRWA